MYPPSLAIYNISYTHISYVSGALGVQKEVLEAQETSLVLISQQVDYYVLGILLFFFFFFLGIETKTWVLSQ